MSDRPLLTLADFEALGKAAVTNAEDPRAVVAKLLEAVERGRLADDDTAFMLTLAAEITEREGDLEAAQALAARAAVEESARPDSDVGFAAAFHARLLLRLGREDEGMARLTAMRPRMTEDPFAATSICEALERAGHTGMAVEWLTDAVDTVRRRIEADEPEQEEGQHGAMLYGLVQLRHRLRHELKLPHDEYDELAIRLDAAVAEAPSHDDVAAELFWPRDEFDQLIKRWPTLADEYGDDWNEHRTEVETGLVQCAEVGYPRIVLLVGSVDGLVEFAARTDDDPADPDVCDDYASELDEAHQAAWPPARNQPCWCGSGQKYKKCCRPRSRA